VPEVPINAHFLGGGPLSGTEMWLPSQVDVFTIRQFRNVVMEMVPGVGWMGSNPKSVSGTYRMKKTASGDPEPYSLDAIAYEWEGWSDGTR
jgi:hypothetical protein